MKKIALLFAAFFLSISAANATSVSASDTNQINNAPMLGNVLIFDKDNGDDESVGTDHDGVSP